MGCCCSKEDLEDHDDKDVRTPLLSDPQPTSPNETQPKRQYDSITEESAKLPAVVETQSQEIDRAEETKKFLQEQKQFHQGYVDRHKELQDSVRNLETMYPEGNPEQTVKDCLAYVMRTIGASCQVRKARDDPDCLELVYPETQVDHSVIPAIVEFNNAGKLVKELLDKGPQLSKSVCDAISKETQRRDEEKMRGRGETHDIDQEREENIKALTAVAKSVDQIQKEVTDIFKRLQEALYVVEHPETRGEIDQECIQKEAILVDLKESPSMADSSATYIGTKPTPTDDDSSSEPTPEQPEHNSNKITISAEETPESTEMTKASSDSVTETRDESDKDDDSGEAIDSPAAQEIPQIHVEPPAAQEDTQPSEGGYDDNEDEAEISIKVEEQPVVPELEHDGETMTDENPDTSFITDDSGDPNQSTCTEDEIFHDTREEDKLGLTDPDDSANESKEISSLNVEEDPDDSVLNSSQTSETELVVKEDTSQELDDSKVSRDSTLNETGASDKLSKTNESSVGSPEASLVSDSEHHNGTCE